MSRPFAILSLLPGLLLLFAGCTGVSPELPPPEPQASPPIRSVGPESSQISVTPPEDDVAEATPPKGQEAGTDADRVTTAAIAAAPESEVKREPESTTTNEEAVAKPVPSVSLEAPPQPQVADTAEPNVPAQPETTLEPEATGIGRTEASGPAEPDATDVIGPEPLETSESPLPTPTEETTAEVPSQATDTDEGETATLAGFYQEYAKILQGYVREDGRVDYSSLRRKRLRLKHLLNEPDELDPNVYQGWPQEERLAFWINTYNLKMLDVIVRNYPIQSSWWLRLTWPPSDIRHIGGIWSDYRFIVMDEEFTLAEVERRLFRKTFGDPRAFLAITYPVRSGPNLRRTPYRGPDLDRQLDEQVRAFLSSDKGFHIDREKAVVHLSALLKPSWRGKEFVGRYGTSKKFKNHPAETRAVLNFLTQYISQEDVYYLEVENYTLAYMNFDWRLNDSARGY